MARVPVGAYVPGDSFFHKAHPFVKFYWVLSFSDPNALVSKLIDNC